MFPFDVSGDQPHRSTVSNAIFAYRMRWKRRRLLLRSWRRRGEIVLASGGGIPKTGVLVFSTMRNEMLRVEHWLAHYRALGVAHFLIVDNASDDGTAAYLSAQPDVSLWTTPDSYKASRFGVDWLTCLQIKHGAGRWCLSVDADELLIYPESNTRNLSDLTHHLENTGRDAFGALMLDLYPKGSVGQTAYTAGDDPVAAIPWFDPDNYRAKIHAVFGNLWIQGGVRDRMFFGSQPERSPTLNKTPLVKWRRGYAYVTSTHQILPRRLNDVFDTGQGDRVSGILLHTKFLPNIGEKSQEELRRAQHFENSDLYQPYYSALMDDPDLWHEGSVCYTGTAQLEKLGLMSRGSWT
ncbi:glycosyltransferase family 2 protein [Octadecabacter sp. G9-8]|uniref:Glycosyltransferase family 2 protein n=1 Tax=Octadecabacter dasysiphoniae TaxID=2909341 RepID=A0ABS9CVX2_9RHOB|nr:glycosyltransferase family 2 protein [Octadecabacter dasysiphoniae]MCF2871422.1 glycosyltransferase family 2 protein [Octadecabacter dasysiphoniae]